MATGTIHINETERIIGFTYFGGQVFEDGRAVYGGGGTNASMAGCAVFQMPVNSAHGELNIYFFVGWNVHEIEGEKKKYTKTISWWGYFTMKCFFPSHYRFGRVDRAPKWAPITHRETFFFIFFFCSSKIFEYYLPEDQHALNAIRL